MAINTQKFLPPKKYEISKYVTKPNVSNLNIKSKKIDLKTEREEGDNSQVLEIKTKLIQIKNLISSTTLIKSYETNQKRKDNELKKRKKTEDELEKGSDSNDKKIKVPSVPGLGFLERVKKFLFSILFGFIAYRLVDHLPKLIEFFSVAKPAFKFLETFSGSLFNSLVNLIDTSYKFVDKIKEVAKDFGGEEAVKNFDKFEERLKGFINSALLFKMLLNKGATGNAVEAIVSSLLGSGGAAGSAAARKALAQRITKTALGGGSANKIQKIIRESGTKLVGTASLSAYERSLLETPGTATSKLTTAEFKQQAGMFSGKTPVKKRMPGKVDPGRKLFQKLSGESGEEIATKVGSKAGAKVFGKAIPFIGPLVDFIVSTVIFHENPGRAAAGSVGSLIGSFLGAAIAGGTTLGIGSGFGFFLGGLAGDFLGRALYDGLASLTVKEYAGGGPVTKSKKPAPTRTIRVKAPKRSLKVQSSAIRPGLDVGGEKKIVKVFPKAEQDSQVSPYDFMKKSSKIMSSTDAFGPLFDLQAKALLGQKPSATDYRNAAQGLNAWMTNAFAGGVTRGGMAFANGGEVDASMIVGGDMTNWIEASLRRFVSPKVDNVIKELMKSLMLQEIQPGAKEGEQPQMTGGEITGLQGDAKEYYDYLISKGMSSNHAMGLVLNIARESSFRPGVQIIDINGKPSGGLFQWNAGRFTNMVKAVPDWKTNWKGQLDYALAEPQGAASGSNYLAAQFNSPMQAAVWWMEKWERVADPARDTVKMQKILDTWISHGMKQGQGPPAMLGAAPGNLSAAQAIASSMGLQVTSYIRPGDPGYHGKGRAMDFQTIGAPGNSGTPSQLSFAQTMVSRYGKNLKQLIYTPLGYGIADGKKVGLDYWGDKTNREHYHHVHVAFAKGGRVSKPTRAIIGEKGPEFVFDADTTKGLDQMMPNLLENLNAAKNKSQLMSILMSYANYENSSNQTIMVELPPPEIVVKEVPVPMGGSVSFSGSGSDPFSGLTAL